MSYNLILDASTMSITPLQSLVAAGTKLWLDSVDPDEVQRNLAFGATGATSNPIIVGDLIQSGRFNNQLKALLAEGLDDESIAWKLTDQLVCEAQHAFEPVWEKTQGDDGWVSFELDPLLEDPACPLSASDKSKRYIELGKKWSAGKKNRMIKVPATEGRPGCVGRIGLGRHHRKRHADFLRTAVPRRARGLLARCPASNYAGSFQIGV